MRVLLCAHKLKVPYEYKEHRIITQKHSNITTKRQRHYRFDQKKNKQLKIIQTKLA